ncbi:uncharacterized protein [Rutidosis leptorrhynchoides]|uniref:uncharacterized protein n=1 Tax=Rutidosis leptorrhynchoides TaxID=125765 RepID=UPI003A9A25CD
MGSHQSEVFLKPTSDIHKILDTLRYDFHLGGSLKFEEAIMKSLTCFPLGKASKSKPKRIYLFTGGGCIHLNVKEMEDIGELLKECGVAVDVFNFFLEGKQFEDSKMALDKFVAAAVNDNNNNNNSKHIVHFLAGPTTDLDEIINRFPHIFSGASPEEEMIARNEITKDPKGNNEAADALDEFTLEWLTVEKVPMSEDEFTPTNGSSKSENEMPPDAIDVESTPSSSMTTPQSTDLQSYIQNPDTNENR